jgi:hypothetical protein
MVAAAMLHTYTEQTRVWGMGAQVMKIGQENRGTGSCRKLHAVLGPPGGTLWSLPPCCTPVQSRLGCGCTSHEERTGKRGEAGKQ